MRRIPSYLKGLGETRARAAGEVARCKALIDQISQDMARAQADVDSCDRLIRRYDERLDPNLIRPIRAWQGRYGKRGELKATIARVLKESYPEPIATTEIATLLQIEFKLDFITPEERRHWKHNTVGNALKDLAKAKQLERVEDPDDSTSQHAYWRWIGKDTTTLSALLESATAAGEAVCQSTDEQQACDEGLVEEDTLPL